MTFCEVRLNIGFDLIVYSNKYSRNMKYVVLDSFYSFFICLSRERQQDTWNKLKTIIEGKGCKENKFFFFWLIFALFNSRCLFWNTLNTEWNSCFLWIFQIFSWFFLMQLKGNGQEIQMEIIIEDYNIFCQM